MFDFKELDKDNKLSSNYFVFEEIDELSINKKDKDNNLLIEGDNYEALKALKTTGIKVDVIYIDPPYNTGKEFIYSDDYSTNPKPVSNDDVHKHSKWLSFMKKRLMLAKELLSEEGVIFVSIDDNEQAYLKVLMDEIFGEENSLPSLKWRKSENIKMDSKYFSNNVEYIHLYLINKEILNFFNKRKSPKGRFNLNDEKGIYYLAKLDANALTYTKSLDYIIKDSKGNEYCAGGDLEKRKNRLKGNHNVKDTCWRWSEEKLIKGIKNNEIVFKNGKVYNKIYWRDEANKPWIDYIDFVSNQTGQKELNSIFNNRIFDHPKPSKLIIWIINLIKNKNSIILDFFAGSGTTGQAVMELNKEDGGNRRFILVTNNERNGYDTIKNPEQGIARAITRERMFRVINGKGSNGEEIKWELPKELQKDGEKYLSNNSLNYLIVKTINKVDGEFEDIDNLKPLYKNEFNKKDFSIVELENE